jgi:hypothetical protein
MKKLLFLLSFMPVFAIAQNVGIGTTTPAAKLDVKAASSYVGQFNGLSPMYMGIFENDLYRGYWGSYSGNPEDVDFGTGSGTTGKLHLTIQANPRLTINNTGLIGVGTTNPTHLMHINGGDLFVQSSSGLIRFGYEGSNEWQLGTTGGGADLRWYTTTDGGLTQTARHYFSQNGNVGIATGIPVPLARLDVLGAGATSATNNLMLRASSGDTLLRMRDDGRMGIGYNGVSYGRTINVGGTGINFYTANEAGFGGAVFPTDTSLIMWSNSGANNYLVLQPSWGNTGIGTYSPNAKFHVNGNTLIGGNSERVATGYSLSVAGKIIAEEMRVQLRASWPDYVFADDYKLKPLEEVEQLIKQNKHLPNIPAASVVEKEGFDLGDMNKRLLEKVEELTLYLIEMKKENKNLQQTNQTLEQRLNKIEKKLEEKN